jgi:hypothetical protein
MSIVKPQVRVCATRTSPSEAAAQNQASRAAPRGRRTAATRTAARPAVGKGPADHASTIGQVTLAQAEQPRNVSIHPGTHQPLWIALEARPRGPGLGGLMPGGHR